MMANAKERGSFLLCRGTSGRATKVACISVTASSIDTPEPSFRISTPKILAAAIAPYSLAPARVTLKGRTWSEYQGSGNRVQAGDVGDNVVQLVDGIADRGADRTYDRTLVDGVDAGVALLVVGTDLVDVGYELALCFVEQVEQCVTIEVDPDEGAGDAALVARVGARIRAAHGVDGSLLTGDGVADRLLPLVPTGLGVNTQYVVIPGRNPLDFAVRSGVMCI
jgi:hypothetical protein